MHPEGEAAEASGSAEVIDPQAPVVVRGGVSAEDVREPAGSLSVRWARVRVGSERSCDAGLAKNTPAKGVTKSLVV